MNRIRRIQGHRRDILLLAGLVLASLPLICLSAAQGTSAPPAEPVLYVDAVNGSDSSSGSCPEEALRTLGAAAARINASPRPSNEIRVLPGTYMHSALKSPYCADINKKYEKKFIFFSEWKKIRNVDGGCKDIEQSLAENQCMIFRVRTVVDEDGKVVSAHYGKIYGPISFTMPQYALIVNGGITTFFNPVENNTNLECDGKEHKELQKGKRQPDQCGTFGTL